MPLIRRCSACQYPQDQRLRGIFAGAKRENARSILFFFRWGVLRHVRPPLDCIRILPQRSVGGRWVDREPRVLVSVWELVQSEPPQRCAPRFALIQVKCRHSRLPHLSRSGSRVHALAPTPAAAQHGTSGRRLVSGACVAFAKTRECAPVRRTRWSPMAKGDGQRATKAVHCLAASARIGSDLRSSHANISLINEPPKSVSCAEIFKPREL